ncbi:MAG: cytochrome c oxidase assembly protein [Actinomycetota bacterium]|nr:cytochrome c oxidase assembly protein [Actinomycetota bacterium]
MQFAAVVLSPPVQLHTLLFGFPADWLTLLADAIEVALAIAYLVGVSRLKAKGRSWPVARTVAFLTGDAVIFIATGSGFASYDNSVFTVHVIQHLLLMNGAPILLALSGSVTLLLQASNRRTQTLVIKILHSRVLRFMTLPFIAWLMNWLTMYVYFLTPVYKLSIEHPLFHDYTHLHFLIAGFFFWGALISVDPLPHKMGFPAKLGYLLSGIPFGSFLGIAIMQMQTSIDPAVHTLADTHMGGSVLWAFGEVFTLAALGVIFLQWARAEERAAVRLDRELYG